MVIKLIEIIPRPCLPQTRVRAGFLAGDVWCPSRRGREDTTLSTPYYSPPPPPARLLHGKEGEFPWRIRRELRHWPGAPTTSRTTARKLRIDYSMLLESPESKTEHRRAINLRRRRKAGRGARLPDATWLWSERTLRVTLARTSSAASPLCIQEAHFDVKQSENTVFGLVGGFGNSGSNMRSVLKATFRHRLKFVLFSLIIILGARGIVSSKKQISQHTPTHFKRLCGAATEYKDQGNGRSPRKPADQRHMTPPGIEPDFPLSEAGSLTNTPLFDIYLYAHCVYFCHMCNVVQHGDGNWEYRNQQKWCLSTSGHKQLACLVYLQLCTAPTVLKGDWSLYRSTNRIAKKWSEALSASKETRPGRPSAPDITAGNPANETFVDARLRQQDVRRRGRAVRRHASSLQPTASWTSLLQTLQLNGYAVYGAKTSFAVTFSEREKGAERQRVYGLSGAYLFEMEKHNKGKGRNHWDGVKAMGWESKKKTRWAITKIGKGQEWREINGMEKMGNVDSEIEVKKKCEETAHRLYIDTNTVTAEARYAWVSCTSCRRHKRIRRPSPLTTRRIPCENTGKRRQETLKRLLNGGGGNDVLLRRKRAPISWKAGTTSHALRSAKHLNRVFAAERKRTQHTRFSNR
ncbi:hypothetical protein PR048_000800 [Dryococelus australis]|uniref:Uncharacterized protein n=1 Tax=Dryococelus australis TaxID=614101 RepID=A0ABQ9IFM7_9NEOP|nr:hypothetical protein PR048_000800 [Dryococelus australis]